MIVKKNLYGYKVKAKSDANGKYYVLCVREKTVFFFFGWYEVSGQWISDGVHKPKFIPYRFNNIADAEGFFFKNINSIVKL